MKNLFDILEAILESSYAQENLASTDVVITYAKESGMAITTGQAQSIIDIAKNWLNEQENGNGEWSRMREDAKVSLTCYQQVDSGDVATTEMWESDFNAMDIESWFGLPSEECETLHWLIDQPSLKEVEWDGQEKEWVRSLTWHKQYTGTSKQPIKAIQQGSTTWG